MIEKSYYLHQKEKRMKTKMTSQEWDLILHPEAELANMDLLWAVGKKKKPSAKASWQYTALGFQRTVGRRSPPTLRILHFLSLFLLHSSLPFHPLEAATEDQSVTQSLLWSLTLFSFNSSWKSPREELWLHPFKQKKQVILLYTCACVRTHTHTYTHTLTKK